MRSRKKTRRKFELTIEKTIQEGDYLDQNLEDQLSIYAQ